jgi:hypothetical protein
MKLNLVSYDTKMSNMSNIDHIKILTTRFNNDTWRENNNYRIKHNIPCIYCVPQRISDTIEYNSIVFVFEMNNSINQIEGIGLIRNVINNDDKPPRIHQEGNFNRFCYQGNYHISREQIERKYSNFWLEKIEYILFKGKEHLKRGGGMTSLTDKILRKKMDKIKTIFQDEVDYISLMNEIKNIFVEYYK